MNRPSPSATTVKRAWSGVSPETPERAPSARSMCAPTPAACARAAACGSHMMPASTRCDALRDQRLQQRRRVGGAAAAGIVLRVREHDRAAAHSRRARELAHAPLRSNESPARIRGSRAATDVGDAHSTARCDARGIDAVREDGRSALRDVGGRKSRREVQRDDRARARALDSLQRCDASGSTSVHCDVSGIRNGSCRSAMRVRVPCRARAGSAARARRCLPCRCADRCDTRRARSPARPSAADTFAWKSRLATTGIVGRRQRARAAAARRRHRRCAPRPSRRADRDTPRRCCAHARRSSSSSAAMCSYASRVTCADGVAEHHVSGSERVTARARLIDESCGRQIDAAHGSISAAPRVSPGHASGASKSARSPSPARRCWFRAGSRRRRCA